MRTRFSISLTLAAILLSSCSFSPQVIKSDDSGDLAYWYNMNHGAAEKAELQARNVIPAAQWPAVDQNQVEIGMGPIAVEAAWGEPVTVNTTTTGAAQDVQWVYRTCETCNASYVYFTNNVVTAIQN